MKEYIRNLLEKAMAGLKTQENWGDFDFPGIEVDYPKNEAFGDYTTNVAMVLAKLVKKNPMEIAESVKNEIQKTENEKIEKIEVAVPGHINFYLSKEYLQGIVAKINAEKENFGNSEMGKSKKIQVEFISCNPTGPVHLGNGRGGPIGDALSNVLQKTGHKVTREFYVNDFGNQVEILGHSILGDELKQYRGDYIDELAKKRDSQINDPMKIGNWAANVILDEFIKPTCEKAGVHFDVWFSEKNLHGNNEVKSIITFLEDRGLIYEKDGAVWYKSTDLGDDKDRVLKKTDGKTTYLANDLAYHKNKVERGFDKIINIQGADHHKEAEVVKNFVEKVLGEEGKIDYILSQIVRIIKDGQEVKMSKRKGVYFALDDLIDEVGRDAVRFIFTSYAPTSHINFDINLAKERSEKNPVFYVQYAHARISSILRKSQFPNPNFQTQNSKDKADLSLLTQEKELALIKKLNKFPELIEEVSKSYEVHKLPFYAISLADSFHSFYNDLKVLDSENLEVSAARLKLVKAVKIVLAETLRLIGVGAPDKM